MPLNIKNPEVERLARELAELTGETKTEAVRQALVERKERLALRVVSSNAEARALAFLEQEIWPLVPPEELGRELTREEEEEILGLGAAGV